MNDRIEIDVMVLESLLRLATGNDSGERFWYTMADCAKARGYEASYFHRRKYLLPGFGIFDDPGHKRFYREHFLEWIALPLDEHERRWGTLSAAERREIGKKREPQ
jgi:hypothetical protein